MSRLRALATTASTVAFIASGSTALIAQDARRSLDITVNGSGLSIGDSRRVNGLRINFRDTRLVRVNGVNATVWAPAKSSHGDVNGLALGVPAGGARNLRGISLGAIGIGADETMSGIGIGAVGLGAGAALNGVFVGGIGVGGGGNIRGMAVGGVGVGAGGNAKGILIGGIGAGVGGNADGIILGGVGGGVGGSFRGFAFGGVGVGAGDRATGILIGGVGVGAPNVTGIAIGGVGVGGVHLRGVMLSAANVRVGRDGSLGGIGVSAFNQVRGNQHGLTIGVVNYARSLRGAQVGVINIVRDNPRGRRVLPVLNWGNQASR